MVFWVGGLAGLGSVGFEVEGLAFRDEGLGVLEVQAYH